MEGEEGWQASVADSLPPITYQGVENLLVIATIVFIVINAVIITLMIIEYDICDRLFSHNCFKKYCRCY